MKKYLLISLAVLSSMPLMANSQFEIQSIKTVEDVQMVRNRLIDRMTEILASGKLTDERAQILEERINKLSRKPLPTQEQVNWRVENPVNISELRQKRGSLRNEIKRKKLRQEIKKIMNEN